MTGPAKQTRATIIPALRYRDARGAIEFLCNAFGFEKGLVVDGPNGTIAHAQLTFGNGMIMLGSHPHEGEYGKLVQPPEPPEFVNTQAIYADRFRSRCALRAGQSRRRESPIEPDRSGLRRPRLHGARSRRPCLDLRHV